jgi:hypothetical protein
MRRVTAAPAAGARSSGPEPAASPGSRAAGWPGPVNATIAVATVVALGLRVYLLVRPGLLSVTQYDDGPYFGSAVRLVHGVLPYRDYAFVQPPGITLLMAPAAALTYLTGTAWGLAIGRILTVAAGAAAVVLGGLLVRHRGLVAVTVTCGILALYPAAAAAAHTVLLEPWLVLACLAAMVAVFDGDRLASSARRLALGGVAFGFGGAVKAWAIAPVLVVFLLCLVSWPRAGEARPPALASLRHALAFAGGVAAGFCVPVLAFVVAAPRQFYQSVVVAQLARIGRRAPLWHRLQDMVGLPGQHWPVATVAGSFAALAAVAVGGLAAAWVVSRRPPPPLDWFAVATSALVVVMFLWPPYFADHYVAFLGPFLALALALPMARLAAAVRPASLRAAPAAVTLAFAGLVALAVLEVLPGTGPVYRPTPPSRIARLIPPGACVVSDQASYLLLANRFVSTVPGCPQMVDSLGTDLALSGGRRPGTGAGRVPAVAAAWQSAFAHAQYAVLSIKSGLRIAWTPRLLSYFFSHFRAVRHTRDFTVYARNGFAVRGHRHPLSRRRRAHAPSLR